MRNYRNELQNDLIETRKQADKLLGVLLDLGDQSMTDATMREIRTISNELADLSICTEGAVAEMAAEGWTP